MDVFETFVEYAKEDPKRERCGFIILLPTEELEFYPITNIAKHDGQFETDPLETKEFYEKNFEVVAFAHSHVRGEAVPSETDIEWAKHSPDSDTLLYAIYAHQTDSLGVYSWNGNEYSEVDH